MINNNNITYHPLHKAVEQEVLLDKITLNPEDRIRQEKNNYVNVKYIGIRESMRYFGLWHPITVKKNGDTYILIAGFLRFCATIELGWTTIRANVYTQINALEMRYIELAVNITFAVFTQRITPLPYVETSKSQPSNCS